MKCFLLALLFISFHSSTLAQETEIPQKRDIVFQDVNVIPMDAEHVLTNQDVVVKGGRIISVKPSGKTVYPKTMLIIDGKGKYLMPGLAEMHAHIPPVDSLQPMKEVVLLFALKGVTTIRGMLGHPLHLELRKKLGTGEILGPRLYTAGPSFNGQTVQSPQAAEQRVRDQKKAGYDFLKLHPGLTLENFNAIVSTAKKVQIPFAGHVSFDVGIWRAIDAGYASIEHLDGFIEALVPGMDTITEQEEGSFGMFIARYADTSRIPKLVAALKEKKIWVVPTQSLAERWFSPQDVTSLREMPEMTYVNPTTLNSWGATKNSLLRNPNYNAAQMQAFINLRRKLIYACQKGGVGLLLGSDAPQVFNVAGFSLHQELEYMVKAGLTPYEALRMGTVNPAAYFHRLDMGVVKPGYVSDLILLNGNPLIDIKQTRSIEGVMLGNRWLSKTFIAQQLKRLEKH